MNKNYIFFIVLFFLVMTILLPGVTPNRQEITLNGETVTIYFIGHGSLAFVYKNTVIHIDPYSGAGDYNTLLKADIILISHEHGDHLDKTAIAAISGANTILLAPPKCRQILNYGEILANGDKKTVAGITIEAVPSYNPSGKFHIKGVGNGYIMNFGKIRVYVAGDTEYIEEMKNFGPLDIAFLPVNRPYTMTAESAAFAAKTLKPKILFPYHYLHGETNVEKLPELLRNEKNIDVRLPYIPHSPEKH